MTELGPGEEEVCASGGSEGSRDAVLRNSDCAGAAPKHSAPRICQLSDAGFRDWTSLVQIVTDGMENSTSVADASSGRPTDTMLKGCLARGSGTWLLVRPPPWCMPDLKATKS